MRKYIVALVISITSVVVASVSLIYALHVASLVLMDKQSEETATSADYSGPDRPTDEEFANQHYDLRVFDPVKGASAGVVKKCADIREDFVSGIALNSGTGFMPGSVHIEFNDPKDPLNVSALQSSYCQSVGAYRQKYINDGERDPGYGVQYVVNTNLSINSSKDTFDIKENDHVGLYSRYKGDAYLHNPITGPACSIHDGSRVTYLRTIDSGVSGEGVTYGFGYGTLLRYSRPVIPVKDTEKSRYAGTPQCADGQLIVTSGLDSSNTTKVVQTKK